MKCTAAALSRNTVPKNGWNSAEGEEAEGKEGQGGSCAHTCMHAQGRYACITGTRACLGKETLTVDSALIAALLGTGGSHVPHSPSALWQTQPAEVPF